MKSGHHFHIEAGQQATLQTLKELWDYRDLVFLYTRKNFVIRYSQTILGPLWIFIVPLLTGIVHAFVFGRIAGIAVAGIPPLLFYLVSTALWTYFAGCIVRCADTFTGYAHLFGKVYFPRLVIPLSHVLTCFLELLSQLLVVALFCIWYVLKGELTVNIFSCLLIGPLALWLALLGMGIGDLLAALTAKYRDLKILTGFGIQLWMYLAPVVYPLSRLEGLSRTLILLDPVSAPIELCRYCLLGHGGVPLWNIIYSLVFTAVIFFLSFKIFNKVERNFLDTV